MCTDIFTGSDRLREAIDQRARAKRINYAVLCEKNDVPYSGFLKYIRGDENALTHQQLLDLCDALGLRVELWVTEE